MRPDDGVGERSAPLRPVLAAEAASNFGSMLSRLAIPWLAALALDAAPWQMGLLLVADVVAGALAALWLGAWVERRDKRRVMLACDGVRALLLGLLALAAWAQLAGMGVLLGVAAASAVATMAFELARGAWIAQRIAAGDRVRANASLSVAGSLSETAAFAAGGWLYQWWGAVVALTIDAASYLVSALFLRRAMSAPPLAPTQEPMEPTGWRSAWTDAREGLAAIWREPRLRGLAGLELIEATAMAVASTSYMIFVSRDIGFATGTLGVVFACGGLGSVIGARLAATGQRRLGAARCIALGLALAALGAACTPMVGAASVVGIALLVTQQVVGDAGATLFQVHARTWRQSLVEPGLVARVDAGLRTGQQMGLLVGALVGAIVAGAGGSRVALIASAGLLAVAALFALGLRDAPGSTAGDGDASKPPSGL